MEKEISNSSVENRIVSRFNTEKYFGQLRRSKVANPSEILEYEDVLELSPRSYHT